MCYLIQRTSEYLEVLCVHKRRNYFSPYNTQNSANDNVYILYVLPNTFCFVFLSVQNFAPDSITTWEVQAISISPQTGISIGYFIWFISMDDNIYFLKQRYNVRLME